LAGVAVGAGVLVGVAVAAGVLVGVAVAAGVLVGVVVIVGVEVGVAVTGEVCVEVAEGAAVAEDVRVAVGGWSPAHRLLMHVSGDSQLDVMLQRAPAFLKPPTQWPLSHRSLQH